MDPAIALPAKASSARARRHQGVVWVSGHASSPEFFFVFKVKDFGKILVV